MSDYDNLITQSIQADRAQSARVGFTTAANLTAGNIGEAMRGDDTHAGAEALRFARSHAPFVNLWYARWRPGEGMPGGAPEFENALGR